MKYDMIIRYDGFDVDMEQRLTAMLGISHWGGAGLGFRDIGYQYVTIQDAESAKKRAMKVLKPYLKKYEISCEVTEAITPGFHPKKKK